MGLIQKRMSKTGIAGEVFPLASAYELCCGETAKSRCDYEAVKVFDIDDYKFRTVNGFSYNDEDGNLQEVFFTTAINVANPQEVAKALNEELPDLGYMGQFAVTLTDNNQLFEVSATSELDLVAVLLDGGDQFGFGKVCSSGFAVPVFAFNDRDPSTGGNPGDQKQQVNEPYVADVLMILYDTGSPSLIERGYAVTDGSGQAIFEGVLPGNYSVGFQLNWKGGDGFTVPSSAPSTEPFKKLKVTEDGTIVLDLTTSAQWIDAPTPNYPLS